MTRILISGPFGAPTGVGVVVEAIAAALEQSGLDVERQSWGVSEPSDQPKIATYDVVLACINPDAFVPWALDHQHLYESPNTSIVGIWFWEVLAVPESHLPAFELVDEIWALSEHAAEAFRSVKGSRERPVHVVPIPLDIDQIEPAKDGERPTVLGVFDLASGVERKNPDGLLDAFCSAFPDSTSADAPRLILKLSSVGADPVSANRLRARAAGRSDVELHQGKPLERTKALALIAGADLVVSLHRAEGLGLPLFEATALGVPTLATGWSGNLAFMPENSENLVPSSQVDIPVWSRHHVAGTTWAEPDLVAAAVSLREWHTHRSAWTLRAADARTKLLASHGSAMFASAVAPLLAELRPHSERSTPVPPAAHDAARERARAAVQHERTHRSGLQRRLTKRLLGQLDNSLLELSDAAIEDRQAVDQAQQQFDGRLAGVEAELARIWAVLEDTRSTR